MSDRPFAVLGLFDSAEALMAAIPKMKASGFDRLEAYTPYPVHGLDHTLGQKPSPLGKMVLGLGIAGAALALAFQWWTSVVDYPIPTGGKALFAWQSFVPISFEVTVLFATFTAGLGMLVLLNRLPFFGHPVLHARSMASLTRDKLALSVESWDGEEEPQAAEAALRAAGALEIEVVPHLEWEGWSPRDWLKAGAVIALACAVAGGCLYAAIRLFPVLPPMSHMLNQPRQDAFAPSDFFKDGRSMRPPADGAVARDHLPASFANSADAAGLVNPLPATREVMERGRQGYNTYCAVCHGEAGTGVPRLSSAYGAKPANLQSDQFQKYSDGQLYGVITVGKNAMPSYAYGLTEEERWAVVRYMRALQRAENAHEGDLP